MESFTLDRIFWMTVLLIFLLTLIGALVRRLRRDRCLKLLHDHHATYLSENFPPIWGDLKVSSQGVEIVYDSPFVNTRNLTKAASLIYESDMPRAAAFARTIHGLSLAELAARRRQIALRVNPPFFRRVMRSIANFLNMVRDAIANTLSLFMGRFAARGEVGQAVKSQSAQIQQLSGSVLGMTANAYEPLLERHIGKPVVLQLANPEGSSVAISEFPGYLVEYNEKFIAIFNPGHEPEEEQEIEIDETTELSGLRVELLEREIALTCTGQDAIIVRRLTLGDRELDMSVVLLTGRRLTLNRRGAEAAKLHYERTRNLDLICPRSRAAVRYAGSAPRPRRRLWRGIAPAVDDSEENKPGGAG